MTEPEDEPSSEGAEIDIPPWDADSITRRRAEASRAKRDAALQELRVAMSDEEILGEFGIDTSQFEG